MDARRPLSPIERLLFAMRFVVVPVAAACAVMSIVQIVVATSDVVRLAIVTAHHLLAADPTVLHEETATLVVKALDGYLIATVALVFAFGLWELFIRPLPDDTPFGRSLVIRSLEDLKDRLAKLILMVLVVELFKHALAQRPGTPLDLLQMAGAIVLVAAAVRIAKGKHDKSGAEE